MSQKRRDTPPGAAAQDRDRLWAALEGATEGPNGRGRDQEVISQTERRASQAAAADRASAAAELYEAAETLVRAEPAVEVVARFTEETASGRVLSLRSTAARGRDLTLHFDLMTGAITERRSDGIVRSIDPFDAADRRAGAEAIRASLTWLRDGPTGASDT
jgi:hypothetical protein